MTIAELLRKELRRMSAVAAAGWALFILTAALLLFSRGGLFSQRNADLSSPHPTVTPTPGPTEVGGILYSPPVSKMTTPPEAVVSPESTGAPELLTIKIFGQTAADITLSKDGSAQLTTDASAEKRKDVSWSSDDESVAAVDKTGLLSAVGDGSTTIRASLDGAEGSILVRVRG